MKSFKHHHKISNETRCVCGEKMIVHKNRWLCRSEIRELLRRFDEIYANWELITIAK